MTNALEDQTPKTVTLTMDDWDLVRVALGSMVGRGADWDDDINSVLDSVAKQVDG